MSETTNAGHSYEIGIIVTWVLFIVIFAVRWYQLGQTLPSNEDKIEKSFFLSLHYSETLGYKISLVLMLILIFIIIILSGIDFSGLNGKFS